MENQSLTSKLKQLSEKRVQIELKERLLRTKERKRQTRRLIELGSMLKRCGIDTWDDATLMGAFLEIQQQGKEAGKIEGWKKRGGSFTQTSALPLIVSSTQEVPDAFRQIMKDKRFKWNIFRKEWYGYGVKEEIEELVKAYNGKVVIATE